MATRPVWWGWLRLSAFGAIVWIATVLAAILTDGSILSGINELAEIFWVAVAAVLGVSVSQWTMGISLFTAIEDAAEREVDRESTTALEKWEGRRDKAIRIVEKTAQAGLGATVFSALWILVVVSEAIDVTIVFPWWRYTAVHPLWLAGATKLALLVMSARLLYVQFGSMATMTRLFSALGRRKSGQGNGGKSS